MTHSLDRLSDRERDLLILLARGHTAKTIARDCGLSVNVVNEHLRSARRKTDAPSSRELARLVAAAMDRPPQENEDKLFGIESSAASANRLPHQGIAIGARTVLTTWRVTMTLGVLIAAGVLAWQTSVPAQADPSATPDSGASEAVAAQSPDVIYQVIFQRGEDRLGSPTVVGQYGREVRVEIPNTMRVTMVTEEPGQDGRSYTTATMSLFQDNGWKFVKEMSMTSLLSSTPSFEHSVEGTSYRFVVMPRLIVPPAD